LPDSWCRLAQATSYPDGTIVVEVLRHKFDGDAIAVQCREKDTSWDDEWVKLAFAEADKPDAVLLIPFENRVIGKEYEFRAKVHPSPHPLSLLLPPPRSLASPA